MEKRDLSRIQHLLLLFRTEDGCCFFVLVSVLLYSGKLDLSTWRLVTITTLPSKKESSDSLL